jgi:hypothetical protein
MKDSWAIRDHEKGLVDQLEDRRLCKAEALGSSPSESIEQYYVHTNALSSVMLLRKGRLADLRPRSC